MPSDKLNMFTFCGLCVLDTGLWGVHFVSSEDKVNPMIEKIACEWARVANSASDEEVQRAKRSLKTNLMLQMDGGFSVRFTYCLGLMKSNMTSLSE